MSKLITLIDKDNNEVEIQLSSVVEFISIADSKDIDELLEAFDDRDIMEVADDRGLVDDAIRDMNVSDILDRWDIESFLEEASDEEITSEFKTRNIGQSTDLKELAFWYNEHIRYNEKDKAENKLKELLEALK